MVRQRSLEKRETGPPRGGQTETATRETEKATTGKREKKGGKIQHASYSGTHLQT